jgi:hypothetical protein
MRHSVSAAAYLCWISRANQCALGFCCSNCTISSRLTCVTAVCNISIGLALINSLTALPSKLHSASIVSVLGTLAKTVLRTVVGSQDELVGKGSRHVYIISYATHVLPVTLARRLVDLWRCNYSNFGVIRKN